MENERELKFGFLLALFITAYIYSNKYFFKLSFSSWLCHFPLQDQKIWGESFHLKFPGTVCTDLAFKQSVFIILFN